VLQRGAGGQAPLGVVGEQSVEQRQPGLVYARECRAQVVVGLLGESGLCGAWEVDQVLCGV